MATNAGFPYRILGKLGSSGMGIVYKAEDVRLGRLVALKFLSEELSYDSKSLARFRREARAACALNHPNICTVYDLGEHEGRHFIAMELLEGETLAACIKRRPFALPDAVRIALGLLAALQVLHRKEMIHRDLQPSNVFLTENGSKSLTSGWRALPAPLPRSPKRNSPRRGCSSALQPISLRSYCRVMPPRRLRIFSPPEPSFSRCCPGGAPSSGDLRWKFFTPSSMRNRLR
jgi:serine/threonine protein kinase